MYDRRPCPSPITEPTSVDLTLEPEMQVDPVTSSISSVPLQPDVTEDTSESEVTSGATDMECKLLQKLLIYAKHRPLTIQWKY